MKKLTTLLFTILSYSAFSQPIISHFNLPQVGDHVVIGLCSDNVNAGTVGNAGAMQTWDMTGLTETSEEFFDYINPSTGLQSDSFPSATICGVSWLDDYSYYGVNSSSLTAEGYVVTIDPSDTGTTVYTNPEQILQMPYTFGDTFTDNFAGTNYLTNFGALDFDGIVQFEADGYGTLMLPNGTYNNVVRYYIHREQTNYVGGFPSTSTTKDQWAWVSEDYRFWLLLMESNFDGFSTSSLVWYDKNPFSALTGINSINESNVSVYPNPLKVGQSPMVKWAKGENVSVSVLGLDGQIITNRDFQFIEGNNTIDFLDLSAGIYILQIESASLNFKNRISVID